METFSASLALLWGEFTGHRWIPLTKASDAELWFFYICAWTNCSVNSRYGGDLRRHRTQWVYNFKYSSHNSRNTFVPIVYMHLERPTNRHRQCPCDEHLPEWVLTSWSTWQETLIGMESRCNNLYWRKCICQFGRKISINLFSHPFVDYLCRFNPQKHHYIYTCKYTLCFSKILNSQNVMNAPNYL